MTTMGRITRPSSTTVVFKQNGKQKQITLRNTELEEAYENTKFYLYVLQQTKRGETIELKQTKN